MRTVFQSIAVISTVALLAGCGGGAAEVVAVSPPPQFIAWSGSATGPQVVDGLGHIFKFYADTGCLYNLQTGAENTAFCLLPGTSNVVAYGPFRGEVVNVMASNGTCQAAIIDQVTANFADIEVDAYGREVVSSTELHPAPCSQ